MTVPEALFLGILQGLTEFLPVSSSGHLVIAQSFFKDFSQPGVLFDAALHGGTLLAVLWYFRKRLLALDKRMAALLLLGTIPAGIIGVTFKDFLEGLFSNPKMVGFALLVTGAMNWMVDSAKCPLRQSARFDESRRASEASKVHSAKDKKIGWKDSLFIGVFQAIAIIPGISRSGSTIFAGVFRGINKEEAAVFSFLLSIPAVLGAIGLQVLSHGSSNNINIPAYLIGMIAAAIGGYFSIGILIRLLLSRRFRIFALYCFIVGAATILLV